MRPFASARNAFLHRLAPVLLMLASPFASAHSGHDHSHWMSDAIHALALIALLAVATAALHLISRRRKQKR